ncbi:37390_t:CDS:1, partial [Gigaspora margarita]
MSTKTTKSVKENEHYKLLQSAKNEYKKENYSASVCSLTSIIDHCGHHENEQVQLLVIEAKFWLAKIYEKDCSEKNKKNQAFQYYYEVFNSNSKLKETARNHLMRCYNYGIGVKKDVSKVEELYQGKT